MSDAARNLIYPPVMDTYQTSNCVDEPMVITYVVPEYNLQYLEKIKSIHVSLTNQSNNASVLKSGSIKIIPVDWTDFNENERIKTFELTNQDVLESKFQNTLYKIQVRFDFGTGPDAEESLNTYLTANKDDFSEWSSVSLIKPIIKPQIVNLATETEACQKINYIISAALSFNESETETLDSYRFTLGEETKEWKKPDKDPLGLVESFNLSSLEGTLPLTIEYKTSGGYHGFEDGFSIIVNPADLTVLTSNLSIKNNSEYGFNDISVEIKRQDNSSPHLCEFFRSENNGIDWNKIGEKEFYTTSTGTPKILQFRDASIKSGMLYKYAIQISPINKTSSTYKHQIINAQTNNFYNATLTRKNEILKLSFDFSVSQYSKKAGRAMNETLGGRYPKFTKNGRLNYKQCSIAGKISIEDNLDGYFITVRELLGETLYNNLVNQNNCKAKIDVGLHDNQLPQSSMIMVEREFREKVYDWLNDGQPKLFKSGPEGNMIVMLDAISLTSEKTIGRLIYSFSATMYEIGDANDYDSLISFGIINKGDEE